MNDDKSLAQTENFVVWTSNENNEMVYHIELGGISLHLTTEEWNEFVTLVQTADQS